MFILTGNTCEQIVLSISGRSSQPFWDSRVRILERKGEVVLKCVAQLLGQVRSRGGFVFSMLMDHKWLLKAERKVRFI